MKASDLPGPYLIKHNASLHTMCIVEYSGQR